MASHSISDFTLHTRPDSWLSYFGPNFDEAPGAHLTGKEETSVKGRESVLVNACDPSTGRQGCHDLLKLRLARSTEKVLPSWGYIVRSCLTKTKPPKWKTKQQQGNRGRGTAWLVSLTPICRLKQGLLACDWLRLDFSFWLWVTVCYRSWCMDQM